LDTIIELGKDRGIVEIGAGNGQWARALMDRYHQSTLINAPTTSEIRNNQQRRNKKKFDFVLAYDNKSELPLDQTVVHKKTQIHRDFFYDKVQKCNDNFSNVLRHWECRGRILLLVYPPPGSMAVDAIVQYVSASQRNDIVIYIGEGRQGANANDDLFDQLENGEWILRKELEVKPFGSKGYEKLYVLQRRSIPMPENNNNNNKAGHII
jgi:hypothetical protein